VTLNVSITSPVDTSGNLKVAVQSSVTINVAIVSSSATLDVNIKSQATTLNVNISGSSITLNVSVTSPLDTSGNLKVSVQSSVTINVNISGQSITLNVNINSVSAGLNLPVDIKAQSVTLNVNIAGASTTVNVNISAQSIVLNINVSDAIAQLTHTTLLLKGNRVIVSGYVSNGSATIYTVPSGKTAYIIAISYNAFNFSGASPEGATLYLISGTTQYTLIDMTIKPSDFAWGYLGAGIIKMNAGESLKIAADVNVAFKCDIVIMEV
jgi:hypothetical protein